MNFRRLFIPKRQEDYMNFRHLFIPKRQEAI